MSRLQEERRVCCAMPVPAQFDLNSCRVNPNLQQLCLLILSVLVVVFVCHAHHCFLSGGKQRGTLELSYVGASFKINWLLQIVSLV